MVEMLAKGELDREAVRTYLYLPIIIFIGEVYRKKYGGSIVNGEKGRLNPSFFKCVNGEEINNHLAVYMKFQSSSVFLNEVGMLSIVYEELVSNCKRGDD